MQQLTIPKQILWVQRVTSSSPNRIIVSVGSITAILLFVVAVSVQGILSDFLLNLSAGVVTVVFTVILVDVLRTAHMKKRYAIPQNKAVERLRASHAGFLVGLSIKVYKGDPELTNFAKKFMDSGEEANKGNMDATSEVLTKYAQKISLLKATEVLKNYSKHELTGVLKGSLEKIRDDLEKISRRYEFSFIDLEFNTDLAELINSIDGVIGMFVVLDLDSKTLSNLLKPASTPDSSAQIIIGSMLLHYLKTYTSFLYKYGTHTDLIKNN